MRNLHNVEKSGFRKGEYVGYADGAWRIARNTVGTWTAHKGSQCFTRRTLGEVSKALDDTAAGMRAAPGASN